MRRVVFVDLDDTLFQTQRKNPAADRLAAVDRDGAPLSFRCGRQEAFFDWLAGDARMVAVTGRSVAAFRRVMLPLGELAVCSFGGVILGVDGLPEPAWQARMAGPAAAAAAELEAWSVQVTRQAAGLGIDVRQRIIADAGLKLYLSIKHNRGLDGEAAALAQGLAPGLPAGWTLHHNGANLALLPPFLGKAAAVSFLLERLADEGPLLTLGVGDSLTDLGFMGLCDYVIAPSNSQIVASLAGGRGAGPAASGRAGP